MSRSPQPQSLRMSSSVTAFIHPMRNPFLSYYRGVERRIKGRQWAKNRRKESRKRDDDKGVVEPTIIDVERKRRKNFMRRRIWSEAERERQRKQPPGVILLDDKTGVRGQAASVGELAAPATVKGSAGGEGDGGDAGGQSEGFAEERLADQTKTFGSFYTLAIIIVSRVSVLEYDVQAFIDEVASSTSQNHGYDNGCRVIVDSCHDDGNHEISNSGIGGTRNPLWMLGELPGTTKIYSFAEHTTNEPIHYLSLTNLNSVTVHAGTNQLSQQGQSYGVSKIVAHRGFSSITLVNDVALILVNSNIAFNNLVQPIKLATGSKTYEGATCVLSGWGTTKLGGNPPNNLQYINLLIETQAKCKRAHSRVQASHICTYTKVGEGACDSGGPLVVNDVQVGIVSFGQPCAVGKPDVYTRVSSFVSWIDSQKAYLLTEQPGEAIYIV
ncbi:Chymotrypsin-1 [Melipona quadrifasciata]|uniref:Chymotrypsin-1 n=1 Tax=Melipona quadrifasciata TaxID=166423 RepID=A0A0M9A1L6_9HYME|nr:Chymotrypsin-1 [Melipona quadrifasciata]